VVSSSLFGFRGHRFDLGSNMGIQVIQEYSVVALKEESGGLTWPYPKQVDDKVVTNYR
jgi:hypothetical protein